MKTFQDLVAANRSELERMEFVRSAVTEHKNSAEYAEAFAAEEYYAKRNLTISKFQKFLYTVTGAAVPDMFGANYKLKTGFFRRFVTQQVQYVLSNGVSFEDEKTKKTLGASFDNRLQTAAKKAMVGGVSFGFWNYDHLEVFGFAETRKDPGFAPLYDVETGELKAGIRFWHPAGTSTSRWTLYEEDGYTEYIQEKKEDMRVLSEKRAYIKTTKSTAAHGVEEETGANYPGFPIIPLYANDLHASELVGIRESIDCYDFVKSGLANDIDEGSHFYWILENTGGMDDTDLQRFIERMKVVRTAVLDPDVKAEAHTLDIPTQARETMLNILKNDLYEDFQIVDVKALSSGNKTATEIRAAYQPMDDKCGDFEYCIRDFISRLLSLVGIEDEPTFKWNRIANQTEETQMVLSAAAYLDDETVLKHLPWLTPEEVDDILLRKDAEALERMTNPIEDPVEE